MSLCPYPEYRDSGLPWLGEVPSHWEVRRNGRLFTQRIETGFPDLPVLEVSLRTGVRVRDMENITRKQVMSDFEKYKRAARGDIAYNMMRMWQGAVGVAPVDGLISPAYVIAKPRPETNTRYYAYLFRVGAYMQEVNKFSHGIVADRNRLYWEDFKQMPSVVPPTEEQKKIADFLAGYDSLVERLIRTKQRLIELLTEQKQAIIHRAVTRGLDPGALTKPTGLDWLPEVPEHWEVKPLKQVAAVRLSGVDKHSVEGEQSVLLCNYTDVYNNDFIDGAIDFMPATATEAEIKALTLNAGDVLTTKDSEAADDIAVPALVHEDLNGVLCGYHLALVRPVASSVRGEYLFRVLSEVSISRQFHVAATGVTRFGISKQDIKNALVPLPPLDEQDEICRWIVDEVRTVDAAIQRARREIDLIREYRTRLISDVVTGKLDVREAELPEPTGEEDTEVNSLGGLESVAAEGSPDTEEALNADL